MRFTKTLLLAVCTLFPTLLVAAESLPLEPTVNFATEKRDTTDLVSRNYCKNGFFCVNREHCCLDGWGCCASSLIFFPTLQLNFQLNLNISQMVDAVRLGKYLLALKSFNGL